MRIVDNKTPLSAEDAKVTETEAKRCYLLEKIQQWASNTDNVRALVQTGSLVRADGLADEFSDIDIEIIAREPHLLAVTDGWIGAIGETITVLHLDAEDDQQWPTRLVIFEGRTKVDFTLAGLSRLTRMAADNQLDPLYQRGYRLVMDKDNLAQRLPAAILTGSTRTIPTEAHFCQRVEEFWFEAFHVPGYLARNELFLVKQRDWTMKELLLEMIEWHALVDSGGLTDVWHGGKGMRGWAGEEIWLQLDQTFGHFDAEDAWRAYGATTTLYARLAREVAGIKEWVYPDRVEKLLR
ncbi:aminoglycoside 6-adenylyltransferase [Erwinia pyrifoliae DSM 12163]|nr:aminoglycoside adenylyltransferase [Erwinia pyrifoliae]CAX54830.1 Similar to streptomycin adenyltransferase [Erwinia pyrifoliae Ep1/96]CAY73493.1 aminoglycoside 6-adenylyltransferase [Erwinia pyrifoliae DSM 12163]